MRISLIGYFNNYYDKSPLQKANRNNPIPHKFKIDNVDCYFYNADLSGLISISEDINTTIKPTEFLTEYKEGFIKGTNHLNSIGIKTKNFNNPNKIELSITRIKHILYEKKYSELGIGLLKQVDLLPLIWIKGKQILDAGFHNGILHSIRNISNETGIIFTNVDIKPIAANTTSENHPQHNPNLWNDECYNLFKYLFDEYYTKTKRQLTNIWFYLKDHTSDKYIFNSTKDIYKDFILKHYSITITNFDKAEFRWEKEFTKIDEHRINFEKTRKT